jgi:hypothetical protein
VKEIGSNIDPATAEVSWERENWFNPYGLYPDAEYYLPRLLYFARSPGSGIWVQFEELPETTRKVLEQRVDELVARRTQDRVILRA